MITNMDEDLLISLAVTCDQHYAAPSELSFSLS